MMTPPLCRAFPCGLRKRCFPVLLTLGGTLALLGGCAGDEGVKSGGKLTPGDFTTGGNYVVVAVAPPTGDVQASTKPSQLLDVNRPGIAALPAGVDVIGPATASQGVGPTQGTPGAPVLSATALSRVGPAQFVDARVGDINGKPIFASQFFDVGTPTLEPLGTRLAASVEQIRDKKMDVAQWRANASQEIALALRGLVQDELFRAEALASLTPQQRQGLFAFLQEVQENLRRESGGSREAARRRIEEEGLTAEEFLRRREELVLIQEQLRTKVSRRVNVTWRDINQAYNGRMYEKYNPPSQYLFRLIIINADDEAAKAQVEAGLSDNTPFAELATLPLNGSRAANGGLQSPRAGPNDPKDAKFFPNPELDVAAHGLAPGQTSEPIKVGSQLVWIHFDSIKNEKVSVYDAQLEIFSEVSNERFNRERDKYYQRLLSHASVTSLIEMQQRLLAIAEERYLKAPPKNKS